MFDGSFLLNTNSTQILSVHVHNNRARLLGGQGAQLWGPGKSRKNGAFMIFAGA